MSTKDPRKHPEQLGLPLDDLDDLPMQSDEEVAGQMSSKIFRPWYKEFYEGRYTQKESFIARELKNFVLAVVIQGDETLETVRAAMRHLGMAQQVVTGASLQYALARVKRVEEARKNAGANADMVPEEEFTEFMQGTAHESEYGTTGTDF